MSIPKEPRQIMINLMYLVLTAMLALNVSSEILHAFRIINTSIVKSNKSIDENNGVLLTAFQANADMKDAHDRVQPYNLKAIAIKDSANALFNYINDWKAKIVKFAGGYKDSVTGEANREENIDATTKLLVENKGGDEIKQRILNFRNFLLSKLDNEAQRKSIEEQIPANINNPPKSDNNPSGDWSRGTWYNVPVAGALTLFSKLQNDVRSSEAIVIKELFDESKGKTLVFDDFVALAVPKQSYVLQGQPVEAQIMVAAYNKSVSPIITQSSGATKVQDGIGTWSGTASGIGMQTVHGTLQLDIGSRKIDKDWKFEYMVGTTGASMQLDKMNVFYIGVPNPITVTAAGYSIEDVSIGIPGATVTSRGKGQYDVMVTQGPEVQATINAKDSKGAIKPVGGMKVRVKRIPDPIAKVANKIGGSFQANLFRPQIGIAAVLENFQFDLSFRVTSFEFSYQQKHKDYQGPFLVNGYKFDGNPQVAAYMKTAGPGDRVYIENIKAVGPDNTSRSLPTITFNLN